MVFWMYQFIQALGVKSQEDVSPTVNRGCQSHSEHVQAYTRAPEPHDGKISRLRISKRRRRRRPRQVAGGHHRPHRRALHTECTRPGYEKQVRQSGESGEKGLISWASQI